MSKAPATPATDDDAPKKKKRGTHVMAWVLLAMIVGGLGGFGVTNFGGGVTSIGTVGDREISVDDYARTLRQQVQAMSKQFGAQLTLEQARAFGLDGQVIQALVERAAQQNEADRIGLSVGDAVVASQLSGNQAFQGAGGSFDKATYKRVLADNNLTESSYEAGLRDDIALSLLKGSVSGGVVAPAALTEAVVDWAGETRGFTLLRVTEAEMTAGLAEPTEAEITAWYDAHLADYTRPEGKRITYAALLPEALAQDMTVTEDQVKAAYEAKKADYVVPEKRLVERLVFGSDDEAAAAKARLDKGEVTFEALVTERKLTLEDIDLGDVSKADLGAAGEAVFALTAPGVVGPLPSDLGPAIYRMNGILEGSETTLDQARAALEEELRLDAARREISARIEAVDDALAGGATLADLVKEQGMTLVTTDYAPGADDNDPIADQPAFAAAATRLQEGDYPEAVALDNGGLVALQVDAAVPAAPRPLEKVRDKVAAAVRGQALGQAMQTRAEAILAAVTAGASLESQGIAERTATIARDGQIAEAPASLLKTVFEMKPGELKVVAEPGFAAVLRLDQVMPADKASEDGKALQDAIAANAARALSADLFAVYTKALSAEAGIKLDQAAINAVNAQMGN